jgi:glutamate dehydrogenase
MDVRSSVDEAARPPGDLAAEARRSGSATLSWSCDDERGLRCVVGWPGRRPPLAAVLPMFDDLGLRILEHQPVMDYDSARDELAGDVFTFDATGAGFDDEVMALLGEAFLAAWEGRCDRDGFAALAAAARLHARQIQLVRVAFAYLHQAGLGASRNYVRDILLQHAAFVRGWVDHFESTFDPRSASSPAGLDALLEAATTRDEDKVLRWFAGFLTAVTRTNYFQDLDDAHAATIVVKLAPARMPFLEASGAVVETFVHHPDVEGLHVRFSLTARGGLRWSDRLEDYRTEVLALVKAQQVKNALIVPGGAKGAFVVKVPVAELDADAAALQLRRCYRLFVRGLLDVTDNVVGGEVRRPPDTVVLDGDDPYLVVAADKGTAAFSDLANAEAAEAGFWLGDAFASGGSSGYDHKALGVTARGAWVSVRRHLAELGTDVDRDPFTVVGVGDMSGDVFGNGMLLSRQIRLVAAFDHRHLFLDPDPDVARSYAERRRLADLPRSSWDDYASDALSPGGGVFPRTARSVPLSPEAQRRLGVESAELPTDEVVRAILRAPVDLFWNGGIGTYVRASTETDPDVGDRTNDRVRVRADELRCRVVAEGGNLGLTQAARIEYSLAGGRCNADFIDNAGGVNTSDREVNLKILLNPLVESGVLDLAGRDAVLSECAEAVVDAVLADNARQTAAISVAEAHGPFLLDRHARVMHNIEQISGLDRHLAQLPSEGEVARRRADGRGLARPEIAVLLSHAKNVLAAELAGSDVPDDVAMEAVLFRYFPEVVSSRFPTEVRNHRLAREIICTRLANGVIDRVGPGFVYRLEDRTGSPSPECLRRYLVVRDLLGLEQLWQDLDDQLPLADTAQVRLEVEATLAHNACWLVRMADRLDPTRARKELGPHVLRLRDRLGAAPDDADGTDRTAAALEAHGASPSLARRAAAVRFLFPAFDVASGAEDSGIPVEELFDAFMELGAMLRLRWLTGSLHVAPGDSHVTQLAKCALSDELAALRVRLAVQAYRAGGVPAWYDDRTEDLRRVLALADEVAADQGGPDVAALTLGVQLVRELVGRD